MSGYEILPYDKALHGKARTTFLSRSAALDTYFQVQLSQDLKSRVATCFVTIDPEGAVIGFYTLASSGVSLHDLPATTKRHLPKYPLVTVVRMGRLAIDHRFQGQGYGGIMLADAMWKALNLPFLKEGDSHGSRRRFLLRRPPNGMAPQAATGVPSAVPLARIS